MAVKTLLQINSVVNIGSTGRIAEELGQFAIENGWDSYIAYGRDARSSKSKLIKIGSEFDIKLHGLITRLFDRHGFGSEHSTQKLINQIEIIKPDIIHLHNLHGYYLNIESLFNYIKSINIPVVWTLHDCWAVTGHCAHFELIGCTKWKTLCNNCPQKTYYPSSIFLDNSRKNYILKKKLFTSINNLTIVPVSKWLGGIVNQSFLARYPCFVINNGINLNRFKPENNAEQLREKFAIGSRFMLLGVSTTWSKSKGIEDYIKLSKILPNNIVIVLVGLKSKQISKLPKSIIGILRTESTNELAQLYSSADIVLNLSYQETFGLTTVEGFACGTPCIAYNCTASPELITPDTGIIVEKGNIQGVIDAIKTIRDKGKESFSKVCREHAKKLYNQNDRYLDYLNLYKILLNKNINHTEVSELK